MSFSQFVFLSVRNLGHFKGRPKRSTRKPVPRGGDGVGPPRKCCAAAGAGQGNRPVSLEKNNISFQNRMFKLSTQGKQQLSAQDFDGISANQFTPREPRRKGCQA